MYTCEDSIFADFSQHEFLARTIYPDTPRIWSAYLYILGDVDGKTTGNMPIHWVIGTGITT